MSAVSTQIGPDGRWRGIGVGSTRSRVAPVFVLLLVATLLAAPASACGSSLRGDVLIGFGDTYDRSGRQFTHHGLDVAMEAGASVPCVHEGVVVFAGRVPAGPGQSTLAVTIEDDSGGAWSYLPFEAVDVVEGQRVAEGARMGVLATAGDASSRQPHLHIGLRIDGEYADPLQTLSLAGPIETDRAEAGEQNDDVPVAADVGEVDAAVAQPLIPSSLAASSDVLSPESAAPATSPTEEVLGSDVSRLQAVHDPAAMAARDRAQSWWTPPVASASAGAGLSDAPAMLTIAMLGLAMLSGITAGAVRMAQDHAPAEVGADPGSMRLQPW